MKKSEYEKWFNWELNAIRKSESGYVFFNTIEVINKLDLKPWEVELRGMSGASLMPFLCGISYIDPVKARLYPEFIYGFDGEKEPLIYLGLPKKKIEKMFEYFPNIEVDGPFYKILPNVVAARDIGCGIVYDMVNRTGVDINNLGKFSLRKDNDMIPYIGFWEAKEAIELLQPKDFSDLVKIIGLMHGTSIWENNGKELIENGICNIKNIIATREDVYEMLMEYGVPKSDAYRITENVRKGRGIVPEHEKILDFYNLPKWFIPSCNKIKYLYSRAHACQNALNAWRCMWFKENYPVEYIKAYEDNAYKKAFLYGIDKETINKIKKYYDYARIKFMDVTDAYTDLLAIPADYIIVGTYNAKEEEISVIKEYYNEVDAFEKSKFYFVTEEDLKGL